MEIDYNKLFRNCLGVLKEKEGYFRPVRLSEKQLTAYKKVNPEYIIEGKFTAGICIEFFSFDSSFSFDLITGTFIHPYANFDIFVNDNYSTSIIYNHGNEKKSHFIFSTKIEKKKKFTIYFPHSTDIRVRNFEIKDIEYVETKKDLLLTFGDSITQGYVSKFPRFAYPIMISKKLDMDLLNQGMSGYVFESETIDESLKIEPKIITVAFGTNDWDRFDSMDYIKNKINLYFNKLNSVYPNIPVFVITPIWRCDYMNIHKCGTLFDIISNIVKYASKYNFNIVDGMELVPHNNKLFDPECLHPTEEGFAFYTKNLYNTIKQLL